MDEETRRVSEAVVARLQGLGVTVSQTESPDELARLLDAVEEFERAVRRGGGRPNGRRTRRSRRGPPVAAG